METNIKITLKLTCWLILGVNAFLVIYITVCRFNNGLDCCLTLEWLTRVGVWAGGQATGIGLSGLYLRNCTV